MALVTAPAVGTFCWPELCTADAERAKAFYRELMGWETVDEAVPQGGTYTVFLYQGERVAGLYEMAADRVAAGVQPHWNSFVSVESVDGCFGKALSLGATSVTPPFVGGEDRIANIKDPTGAQLSLWQRREQEATRLDEVGALCWTELYTNDTQRAEAFYAALFGWRATPWVGGPVPYTIFNLQAEAHQVGGMLAITPEMGQREPSWTPYFQVDNVEAATAKAKTLAAKTHGPIDIPSIGRFTMTVDPEGAMFAVMEMVETRAD